MTNINVQPNTKLIICFFEMLYLKRYMNKGYINKKIRAVSFVNIDKVKKINRNNKYKVFFVVK